MAKANRAYAFWTRQVLQWSQNSADLIRMGQSPIPGPNDQAESQYCAFTLSPAGGNALTPGAPFTVPYSGPNPNTYWFGDAIAMKRYAGAPNGNYIFFVGTGRDGKWVEVQNNTLYTDIVYEFCRCRTLDTCQNSGSAPATNPLP